MTPTEVDILKDMDFRRSKKNCINRSNSRNAKRTNADQPVRLCTSHCSTLQESCLDCHSAPYVKNAELFVLSFSALLQLDIRNGNERKS